MEVLTVSDIESKVCCDYYTQGKVFHPWLCTYALQNAHP